MSQPLLHRLARLHGVLPYYRDGFRRNRQVSDEALCAVLRELDAGFEGSADAPDAIRRARLGKWARLLEPVLTCWDGRAPACTVRLEETEARGKLELILSTEKGATREWRWTPGPCRTQVDLDGRRYGAYRALLPAPLPLGYHRLTVKTPGRVGEALVIRAPRRAVDLARTWGAFLPLYALRSERSPNAGTYSDLGDLIEWVQSLGGGLVGTLPMLATFLDEPFAPSPYTPVSRYFWNEFYLDAQAIPEWRPELAGTGGASAGAFVDYRGLMRAKRALLERLAAELRGERAREFAQYVEERPELRAYAAFRAAVERGASVPDSFQPNEAACRYHAYVQWMAELQIAELDRKASERGPGLYLDLPLGVHPRGFDRFRHAAIFAKRATGGAPPDRFFSKGQNWGFAPLNPSTARERGHAYFIRCIRHHMRYAGVLRLDHLMGLHRLYWIPEGLDSDQGAYVRYPANELYAIVCLESHRHGTAVVGEDLGTVPAYVRRRMADHGLRRTYVAQFEFRADRNEAVRNPPVEAVASINTHDTALFASFWAGADIEDQAALGLLTESDASDARTRRADLRGALTDVLYRNGLLASLDAPVADILQACLRQLSVSEAECVIVTLEDLWGETEPQNTPGTDHERPNWKRRAKLDLERFRADPIVVGALNRIHQYRLTCDPRNAI